MGERPQGGRQGGRGELRWPKPGQSQGPGVYSTGPSAGSAPRLSQRCGKVTPPHSAKRAKKNSFPLAVAGACSGLSGHRQVFPTRLSLSA